MTHRNRLLLQATQPSKASSKTACCCGVGFGNLVRRFTRVLHPAMASNPAEPKSTSVVGAILTEFGLKDKAKDEDEQGSLFGFLRCKLWLPNLGFTVFRHGLL